MKKQPTCFDAFAQIGAVIEAVVVLVVLYAIAAAPVALFYLILWIWSYAH